MAISKAALKKVAQKAFAAFGDLNEKVSYTQEKPPAYDPDTGIVTQNVKRVNVKAIFTTISENQKTLESVVAGDMLMLMPTNILNFTPELNDTVLRNKDEWTVIGVNTDPANAMYSLHMRLK